MKIIPRARHEGWEPTTQTISVVWSQKKGRWDRNVLDPTISVGIADRYLELNMMEANLLKRKLEDVVMMIEEARVWV